MTEFRFDGFRFDGVTSMLYKHHGLNFAFTGDLNEYFSDNLDRDALVYFMLANTLIKQINPKAVAIAEDVSGFPGLCRSFEDGGFGFDFRLAMGSPDMWFKLVQNVPDEDWKVS